jgi:hypothetical protein
MMMRASLILIALFALASPSVADSSIPDDAPGFGKERPGASRTQLPDGKILIAGGLDKDDNDLPVATVELYDPRTHRFAHAEPMHEARADHLATLLRDGRVLVTGNLYFKEFAEIWDPKTGHWTALDAPRSVGQHTATMLPDGRVLIAGGRVYHDCNVTTNHALLFDPASAQFVATGDLFESRAEHAAVLLSDGRVLVVGGYRFPNAGKFCNALPHVREPTGEIWDPRTGQWRSAGRLAAWREPPYSLTALPGGGAELSGGTAYIDIYPGEDCLMAERGDHCIVEPAGRERWNPSTGKWRRVIK